jgi:transformation/transcription domain-associated protein
LLRGSADWVKPYKETIPLSVVQLLVSCPHDSILVRKELLVATRHILATDFREGFFKHVDTFLNEKQLVGTSRGAGDALRPLAYSLLAEVVHHVRLTLTMQQLSKAVHCECT